MFLRDYNWPSEDSIRQLVTQADGLFVWAATACRYIEDSQAVAADRLQELLRRPNTPSAPNKSRDRINLTVFNKAVSGNYTETERRGLCAVVHETIVTVAVLATPTDGRSLSVLANMSFDLVNKAIICLHSVVAAPDESKQPIRLHHASFRDFITNADRCSDPCFRVSWKLQHRALAKRVPTYHEQ